MTPIERFTRETFEQALPVHKDTGEPLWEPLGLVSGEYSYRIPINGGHVAIEVRSSIDNAGIAAESGSDSIRAWLLDTHTGKPLGSKVSRWTTRLPGWEDRLTNVLRTLWQWRARAGDCPICKQPKGIYKVKKEGKNKGRPFAKCFSCDDGFAWLDVSPAIAAPPATSPTIGANKKSETKIINPTRDKKMDDLLVPIVEEVGAAVAVTPPGSGSDIGTGGSTVTGTGIASNSNLGDVPTSSTESGIPSFLALGKQAVDISDDNEQVIDDDDEPVKRDRPAIKLNEFQQAVIDNLAEGPQTIESCPGSGKTRTLENLVAALIESGVNPSRIGIFTFSNSAAAEARHRIALTLWPDISERALDFITEPHKHKGAFSNGWLDEEPARRMLVDWTCTIHALSLRILKNLTGKRPNVLSGRDEMEANSLIKDSLKELDWEESPRSVRAYISLAVRNLVVPAKATEFYSKVLAGTDVAWRAGHLAEIFRRYHDFCKSRNLIDFDMMQAEVQQRLRNDPAFRKKAQAKFDYLLVDESQDTSSIQAEILWTLAGKCKNIVFCGDVDQSMYKWRGAAPSVMREGFAERWPDVARFNLPVNYRSTKAIIQAASQLIGYNYDGSDDSYLKPFDSRPDAPEGEPLTCAMTKTFSELCSDVAVTVTESPQDWFILSRTRAECAAIHLELIRRGIPAVNKSGGILFGAPHVRKVLAYARLACDYRDARDNVEILGEIANVATVEFRAPFTRRNHRKGCTNQRGWIDCGCPVIAEQDIDYSHTRFYGRKAVESAGGWDGILEQRDETNRGGYSTTRAKGSEDLVRFVHRLERLKDDAGACLNMIVSDCVLPWLSVEYGTADADLAENGKAEDLALLLSMAKEGQTIEEYLDEVENLTQGDEGQDESRSAILGTFHWSKGRESKGVVLNVTRLPIVPPQQQPGKLPIGKPPLVEEERRLAYVGVTRAKEVCHVVGAGEWNGQAIEVSRFIGEMKLEDYTGRKSNENHNSTR